MCWKWLSQLRVVHNGTDALQQLSYEYPGTCNSQPSGVIWSQLATEIKAHRQLSFDTIPFILQSRQKKKKKKKILPIAKTRTYQNGMSVLVHTKNEPFLIFNIQVSEIVSSWNELFYWIKNDDDSAKMVFTSIKVKHLLEET